MTNDECAAFRLLLFEHCFVIRHSSFVIPHA